MFERNIPDKEFEKLSKAITEAILNSKDVKKIIQEIRKKDLVLSNTLMVMILKLETLAKIANTLNSELNTSKKRPAKNEEKLKKQCIDGIELGPNEIAFQEFLAKKFSEKRWLKKNRLLF